jgi:hypothetical protein
MKLQGIMHMEVDLLDSVSDVEAGECHILEGPDEAPKLSLLSNRRPRSVKVA